MKRLVGGVLKKEWKGMGNGCGKPLGEGEQSVRLGPDLKEVIVGEFDFGMTYGVVILL